MSIDAITDGSERAIIENMLDSTARRSSRPRAACLKPTPADGSSRH